MTGSNTRRCPFFGQSGGEVISSTIEAAAIAVAKPLKRCEAGVFVMGRVPQGQGTALFWDYLCGVDVYALARSSPKLWRECLHQEMMCGGLRGDE